MLLQLRDPAVFAAATISADFGCVEWAGGVDLCPTAMHAEVLVSRAGRSGRNGVRPVARLAETGAQVVRWWFEFTRPR